MTRDQEERFSMCQLCLTKSTSAPKCNDFLAMYDVVERCQKSTEIGSFRTKHKRARSTID